MSNKKELTWLGELITDFRRAAPAHEPFVVGAMARDLLLHYGFGVPVSRATEDVDFAFAVANWGEFNSVRDALLASDDFSPGQPASHRLIHSDGMPVDLIPFDGVERADGSIMWPDDSVMSVLGYHEARASAVELLLPQEKTLATVSIPMLALLKVLAWADRHTRSPGKDAADLFLILRSYLNGENTKRLYTDAAHLLNSDDFDYESAGAWLTGHDARSCISNHSEQPDRVVKVVESILEGEINPDGGLKLIGETGTLVDRSLKLLASFYEGFHSNLN
ncbi:MAG: hypothetical protein OES26_00180 [Gammaproteobacteria bacterium]|nr:hypothetical protein [Gammaproteobacteria bacterium]